MVNDDITIEDYKEGKLVRKVQGLPDRCSEFYKNLEEEEKQEEKSSFESSDFNEIQKSVCSFQKDEDKIILEGVMEFYKKNGRFPTPTELTNLLKPKLKKSYCGFYSRKITGIGGKEGDLSKFLEFDGSKGHKGKKMCFTKKFLDLK